MEDLSFDRYEVQSLSAAEMADLNSTDKTHGKMGHLCSSLCGAAMLRVGGERSHRRMHLLTGTLECAGEDCVLR